jgi:hypothetical protein
VVLHIATFGRAHQWLRNDRPTQELGEAVAIAVFECLIWQYAYVAMLAGLVISVFIVPFMPTFRSLAADLLVVAVATTIPLASLKWVFLPKKLWDR